MSAFLVVNVNVKDPDKWKIYTESAPATVAAHGGEFLLRGKLAKVLHGEQKHGAVAVAKFPDQAALSAWYNSDAYQALIPNRDEAADVIFATYDEPPA